VVHARLRPESTRSRHAEPEVAASAGVRPAREQATPAPIRSSPAGEIGLQRLAGNRAVSLAAQPADTPQRGSAVAPRAEAVVRRFPTSATLPKPSRRSHTYQAVLDQLDKYWTVQLYAKNLGWTSQRRRAMHAILDEVENAAQAYLDRHPGQGRGDDRRRREAMQRLLDLDLAAERRLVRAGGNVAEAATYAAIEERVPPAAYVPGLAATLGEAELPDKERAQFLGKVRDKLVYGDIAIAGADSADREVFEQVLAEVLTDVQLVDRLRQLNLDRTVRLVASVFSSVGPYGGVREGSHRIVKTLQGLAQGAEAPRHEGEEPVPNDRQRIAHLVRQLESGYFDEAELRALLTHENPADLTRERLEEIVEALEHHAQTEVATLFDGVVALHARLTADLAASLAVEGHRAWEPPQRLAVESWLDRLKKLPAGHTAEDMAVVARTFGMARLRHRLALDPARILSEAMRTRNAGDLKDLTDFVVQVRWQMDQLGRGQMAKHAAGLERLVLALPTAAKPLADYTFVPTLVERLTELLADIRAQNPEYTGKLADFRILVFDQSSTEPPPNAPKEKPLFARNAEYLAGLAAQTQAAIVHISMREIQQIGGILGIERLLDTTGTGRAGYGGARNIVFLLGPMLEAALTDPESGVTSVASFIARIRDDEAYRSSMVRSVLGPNDTMVLMGDDDTTLGPGFLHAKTLLAEQAHGGYNRIVTPLLGRVTTNVPTFLAMDVLDAIRDERRGLQNFEDYVKKATFGSTGWENNLTSAMMPGMAAAVLHPASALDLPLPSEESLFANYQETIVDHLGAAAHHSGDRYEAPSKRIRAQAVYSAEIEQAKTLLGTGGAHSDVLPWNSQPAFDSLGQGYAFAAQEQTAATVREAFFGRLLSEYVKEGGELEGLGGPVEEAYSALAAMPGPGKSERELLATGMQSVKADFVLSMQFALHLVKQLVARLPQTAQARRGEGKDVPADIAELAEALPDPPIEAAATSAGLREALAAPQLRRAVSFVVAAGTGATVRDAVEAARLLVPGVAQPANRLANNLYLLCISVGAGRFSELTRVLTAPVTEAPAAPAEDAVAADEGPANMLAEVLGQPYVA
jgi:hypothetical protein